ncbi:hypothetical protein KJ966_17870 [bacterium]|nr:hypothetical protein [bacterium]
MNRTELAKSRLLKGESLKYEENQFLEFRIVSAVNRSLKRSRKPSRYSIEAAA